MSIAEAERERFRAYMQPEPWKTKSGELISFGILARIYAIETVWLAPYPPVFYVGVTTDLPLREEQHRSAIFLDSDREQSTPDDFYQELYDITPMLPRWYEACKKLKNDLILCASPEVVFSQLECLPLHWNTTTSMKPSPVIIDVEESLELVKQFTRNVLERERRWIFKKFQEGCHLTNAERVCTTMIRELRASPGFDVLSTPFSDATWNPLITAWLQDEPVLKQYLIH